MRTLFFGTSAFAVPSLHVIAEKTDLAGVVTQPDRPAGRGHKLQPTAVKSAALELGLRVYEPQSLKALAEELAGSRFLLFALASYGKILPQAILDLPMLGALNVHPSLLPKYRGATPIQSALLAGESETGVSIMLMDKGMDTGDIVLQERIRIDATDDYGQLHDRLAFFGADLLGDAIDLAVRGPLPRRPQRGEPSVTRPLRKEDLEIDWSWTPQRIVNAVRAFSPSPGARAVIDGETVKILRAHVDGERVAIDELIAPNRGKMSGESYERSRNDRGQA
ncbi:MAG TPA: methionyl-tRNA formyltransferase [Verrucomicrobiae bacterium]|nr:methionyl-tRNA formyltransferase [Verrucomicrobiae bacterium]